MNLRFSAILLGTLFLTTLSSSGKNTSLDEARFDSQWSPDKVQGKSKNLKKDIEAMWQVVPLKGEPFSVSPTSAVLASERIFKTISLIGLTRKEVANVLCTHLRSNQYGYHAPFWPIPKNAEVYRFDNGCFGWQFTVVYGRDKKVETVRRKWIH